MNIFLSLLWIFVFPYFTNADLKCKSYKLKSIDSSLLKQIA